MNNETINIGHSGYLTQINTKRVTSCVPEKEIEKPLEEGIPEEQKKDGETPSK